MKRILGISAYYHDSAAALLIDGEIVAAAQEERFTRKKHDAAFPLQAVRYCFEAGQLQLDQIDAVVFYEKPMVKFERLLETYLTLAPKGFGSFLKALPVWMKEKLFLKDRIQKEFARNFGGKAPQILFSEHHRSHAASAFYPSPFSRAAVLCLDGVGEWSTSTAWLGDGNSLTPLWEIKFPHSLGLLYSAFTYFTGFKVNSGEYKLMGLAPYGEPRFADAIFKHLVDVKADGTFRLNMDYFAYCTDLKMTHRRFDALFEGPPRAPESPITQREMDLAASIQVVTEEIVLRLSRSLQKETGAENLCLAGGVALNCVANGRLQREKIFKNIWIQPAAGDAGGALGAALVCHHEKATDERVPLPEDSMRGSYLGPEFSRAQIQATVDKLGAQYRIYEDDALFERVADLIAQGKVIGWFQGRMEFGPRALGNRSIIGDARSTQMQSIMNLKIKFRESFRPFAPSVLRETADQYFDLDCDSPYMLLVAPVRQSLRLPTENQKGLWGIDRLLVSRSTLPAITHVDYSARVQTVTASSNARYYRLLKSFEALTGTGVIVNTSFNVRGEPVVCTPEDAYRCFMRTEMDVLVLGNYILEKTAQPELSEYAKKDWMKEFALD